MRLSVIPVVQLWSSVPTVKRSLARWKRTFEQTFNSLTTNYRKALWLREKCGRKAWKFTSLGSSTAQISRRFPSLLCCQSVLPMWLFLPTMADWLSIRLLSYRHGIDQVDSGGDLPPDSSDGQEKIWNSTRRKSRNEQPSTQAPAASFYQQLEDH